MPAFDVLIHGGTVIDGTGAPGQRADVGVMGDRIAAIGDLSTVDLDGVGLVLDAGGRVVAPGFIDPHGHSDGSVFLDGALASHLHQGYTTQLSGNCGDTLAPVTDVGRDLVELSLRPHGLVASWHTFGEYLDRVETQQLGPSTARVLGTYARERGTVSLEAAVAKLSSVPAARLGLPDRGIVREGAFADLVVFDPITVRDEATYLEPARYPSGIHHVIVNGRPTILHGAETGERPGRLLRGA